MNILLINHYAGSPELGMEFRPYYMAKEWVKAGHQVLIVGGSFSHLRKVQPQGKEDLDRKSTRLNSSHPNPSRMPSSA